MFVKNNYLVDFFPKLVGDFSLLGLHELAHHGEDVLATLRSRVCRIEVVKGHILNHLLPLVNVTLRQGNIPEKYEFFKLERKT
jgi:hypothetical protein